MLSIFLTTGIVNKDKKSNENFAGNDFHNILRLLMLYQILLWPQVKRKAIITYKHGDTSCPTSCQTN